MTTATLLFDDRAPGQPPGAPGRLVRGLTLVLLTFLATRLVVCLSAYTGALMDFRIRCQLGPTVWRKSSLMRAKLADPQSVESKVYREVIGDCAPLTKFDGQHYESILATGYHYVPRTRDDADVAREQNIAFFPLYPLLCRPLAWVVSPQAALALGSHLFTLAGAVLFYLWVRWRIDEEVALFGVACLLCWPAAGFYSFGYAEGLTLLLTVAMMMLLERRAFLAAAAVCGLATATRPTATALVPVYAVAYWYLNPAPRGRRALQLLPLLVLAAAGALCYAAFLTHEYGSPLVYAANYRVGWTPDQDRGDWVQFLTMARMWEQFKYFAQAFEDFPAGLLNLTRPFAWNVPFTLLLVVLSLVGLRRTPRSFRPLLLLAPLIFVQAYAVAGGAAFGVAPLGRYTAVAAPAFVLLAVWAVREWRPAVRHAFLTFMLLLQAAWAFRIGVGEWSG